MSTIATTINEQELLCTMALTRVFPYNSTLQRQMLERAGSAAAIYEHRRDITALIPELAPRAEQMLDRLEGEMSRCEEELLYAQNHHIRILPIQDSAVYPARLRQCDDAPTILYYLGTADLNAAHIISIVGTRRCTEYGRNMCQRIAEELREMLPDAIIVSGLAYGIDIAAHRAALSNGLNTVGVLASGLDEIYPRMHRPVAVEMVRNGGLLTELMSYSHIDKINFVQRNRIVAGLADATIVVESAEKGGSLITANIANGYNRNVYAYPGRGTDAMSCGCNNLIRHHLATLTTSIRDVLTDLNWQIANTAVSAPAQKELFPELNDSERLVMATMTTHQDADFSELIMATALPSARLTSTLMTLEMKGIIKKMAGNHYHLLYS